MALQVWPLSSLRKTVSLGVAVESLTLTSGSPARVFSLRVLTPTDFLSGLLMMLKRFSSGWKLSDSVSYLTLASRDISLVSRC